MRDGYEALSDQIRKYINVSIPCDYVVTFTMNHRLLTELVTICDSHYIWLNDWWEGEDLRTIILNGIVPLDFIIVTGAGSNAVVNRKTIRGYQR